MMTPERRIRVELGPRGYDVYVGAGVLDSLGTVTASIGPASRAFLVADEGLPPQTVARAERSLTAAGIVPIVSRVHASEAEKSLVTLERLLVEMTAQRLDRQEPVIALGGGIVGDVAGFASAIYRRGVPLVQCPTTLLAMVDASIGGKTGVNLAAAGELKKNMVGAFHQPRSVLADVSVLGSLPQRVFRAGLAECLKHGLIAGEFGDPGLFAWTRQHLRQILGQEQGPLVELIGRNIAIKAAVTRIDEREEALGGGRALLNLGHTFGHAIETIPDLAPLGLPPPLMHGEAVALGLIAAARCAAAAGLASSILGDDVLAAVRACGLPVSLHGLPSTDRVLALMTHDKKVLKGKLRLVLPTTPGVAAVVEDPPRSAIVAGIDAIRA